jgi:hypothetical protein
MRGRINQLILILIIFGLFLQLASYKVEAVGAPVVTIKFDEGEEEQIADVRPGEHGTVVFTGTVEARIPAGSNVQDVIVNLEGSVDVGWSVTLNPDVVQVDPGGEAHFQATVQVPPETSYYIQATLTVSGTAQSYPGAGTYNVQGTTGTIRIEQFYKFSLSCEQPVAETKIGTRATYELKIHNEGNGRDTFSINVVNDNELYKRGITTSLSSKMIDINEKEIQKINIRAEVDNNKQNIGTHTISVEVYSDQQKEVEGTTFSQRYDLSLKVVEYLSTRNGETDSDYLQDNVETPEEEKSAELLSGFEAIYVFISIGLVVLVLLVNKSQKNRRGRE